VLLLTSISRWAVNFTLNVESFEKGNIRAAFNLLNLAITARAGRAADFFFSSSFVSTLWSITR
jgi:hypothetical protein